VADGADAGRAKQAREERAPPIHVHGVVRAPLPRRRRRRRCLLPPLLLLVELPRCLLARCRLLLLPVLDALRDDVPRAPQQHAGGHLRHDGAPLQLALISGPQFVEGVAPGE
jgi:hypothetical protein